MDGTIDLPLRPSSLVGHSPASRILYRHCRIARTDRWTVWHLVAGSIMGGLAVLATIDAWSDILLIARKKE
jgi:hypothetical protein